MLDVEVAIVSPMRMDANAATFLAVVVVCATTYTIWKMNCAIQAIGSTSRSTINWICSIATPVMVRMMRRRRTGMRRRRSDALFLINHLAYNRTMLEMSFSH